LAIEDVNKEVVKIYIALNCVRRRRDRYSDTFNAAKAVKLSDIDLANLPVFCDWCGKEILGISRDDDLTESLERGITYRIKGRAVTVKVEKENWEDGGLRFWVQDVSYEEEAAESDIPDYTIAGPGYLDETGNLKRQKSSLPDLGWVLHPCARWHISAPAPKRCCSTN